MCLSIPLCSNGRCPFSPNLAFNFGSSTFAYSCSAQVLKKSVTKFSSFFKHYLDLCLAANVCKHFMDDCAAGVNNFEERIPPLRKFFDCLRESGLKFSAQKCDFGTTNIDYLAVTITAKGVPPKKAKVEKILGTNSNATQSETSETPNWLLRKFLKFYSYCCTKTFAILQTFTQRKRFYKNK